MISPRVESRTGTSSIRSPSPSSIPKVLVILGTRPEAIKLAPVISQLKRFSQEVETVLCVTGQHRSLLDGVLRTFGLSPGFDLDIMQPGQTLTQLTSRLLGALQPVFTAVEPALTVLQGDTTTAFCGALASFYAHVPVAHVEAGLRTFDLQAPFPEELNRVLLSTVAALHFAPTQWASANLTQAGVPASTIHVTGNTAIDAILDVSARLEAGLLPRFDVPLDPARKIVLVTAHRRESAGEPLKQICAAISEIARRDDVQIVWPVHPSPQVEPAVRNALEGKPNIHLVKPLEYAPFVDLLRKSWFVISDSGGIQEESPSIGKPVLVLRDKTERPEATEAGTAKLVGHDPARIVREASRLLDDAAEYRRMSQPANPYGDGQAGARIAERLMQFLRSRPG
jgi:UDP-N-acetylglucosamine 2-epimerase (non-hydrolysing)